MNSYQKTRYEIEKEEEENIVIKNVVFSCITLITFLILVYSIIYGKYILKSLNFSSELSKICQAFFVLVMYALFYYSLSNFPSEIFMDLSFIDLFKFPENADLDVVNILTKLISYYIIIITLIYIIKGDDIEEKLASMIFFSLFFVSSGAFVIYTNTQEASEQESQQIINTDFVIPSLIVITGISLIGTRLGWMDGKKKGNLKYFLPFPELNLIFRLILFLPCLVTYVVNFLKTELQLTPELTTLLLIIEIIVIALYFLYKNIDFNSTKNLLDNPIFLNREQQLNSVPVIVTEENYTSDYALSFWFFINNVNNREYSCNIIKIEDKIDVRYNENENKVDIKIHTIDNDSSDDKSYVSIVNTPIQKWNNMILNYEHGKLDIFMNGKLKYSSNGINIKNKILRIISGEEHGLTGGICHVKYINRSLTSNELHSFYYNYKNKNPPVI